MSIQGLPVILPPKSYRSARCESVSSQLTLGQEEAPFRSQLFLVPFRLAALFYRSLFP